MLLQLNINNFALIEKLSISFEKGFNVLSGETGAGKSILIDAINYVLGGKFNKDFIRTGEKKTYVEAIFSVDNERLTEVLGELGVECEDMLIMSRETFQSGKSIAKVNGKALLISNIKLISSYLLDIHGQHENQNLLEASSHIAYLDSFGGDSINNLLNEYRIFYKELMEIDGEIERLQGKDGDRDKLIDFYKYQIDEIEKANIKIDEDKELEKQYSILSNAEKINKILYSSYNALSDGEEASSIYDKLGLVIRDVRSIEKHLDKAKGIGDILEEAYFNIGEGIEEIRDLKDSIYYDDQELEYINSRIYYINAIKKKYGNSIQEIFKYKENISKQYFEYINSGEILEKLKHKREKLVEKLKKEIRKLHVGRTEAAKHLEAKVKNELDYIGLEKSTFKIEVLEIENFNENGADKVQFLISTNPGEPLKPLEKIVSGGELSRIMLALKTVFVDKDKIPSVIFDEIDTGISGRIAQSVAEKMFIISNSHQVFCVTHLPQIACMSDIHYLISKNVKDDKTFTSVNKLDEKNKEYEIARMIGGAEVTRLTIEHAKELIELANDKKQKICNF